MLGIHGDIPIEVASTHGVAGLRRVTSSAKKASSRAEPERGEVGLACILGGLPRSSPARCASVAENRLWDLSEGSNGSQIRPQPALKEIEVGQTPP